MNTDFNIVHLLEEQAQKNPDAIALIDVWQGRERRVTFRELHIASKQYAVQLRCKGLNAGDGALVLVPMSLELYITMIAIFRVGMIAQFLDPSAGLKHIAQCCEMGKPRAFIGSPKAHLLRFACPALRCIPKHFVVRGSFLGARDLSRKNLFPRGMVEPCNFDTPALLTFTSGSTGKPKAIMRSHGFLQTQHRILSSHLGLNVGQTEFCTLPIFVLANLASGLTSILPDADMRRPANFDVAKIWSQLEKTQPERAAAPPAVWQRLCEYSKEESLPFLETVHTGGGPVTPRLFNALQQLAPQAKIVAVYGSTEAEPIAHLKRDEISCDDSVKMQNGGGLLAGSVVPEIQLRILPDCWGKSIGPFSNEEFESLVLPVMGVGEIVVCGEHVIQGYINCVGDQETKFAVNGKIWHRTGDAGYLDEQNRLWLMGRCSAHIADKNGELYPFAVECAAQQFESVKRAALISFRGQRVLVVECDEEQNMAALQQTLSWAQLGRVVAIEKIPVDSRHNSKVDYPALEQWIKRNEKRLS